MNNSEIKILLTGDLAAVGAAESLPGKPFKLKIEPQIHDLFKKHDLSIVNLESPLTNSTQKIKKSGPHLKGHPESIELLVDLGVNVACLSNNHIRDFSDQGVMETIKICNEKNIHTVGAGRNLNDASLPLYVQVKGKVLAIMNFSENEFNTAGENHAGSNPDDPIHIWYTIQEAKRQSDYQVVIMHGGKEMYPMPTPYQLQLFRYIADLGVTAIIGHHSHVIGGYEVYKGIPIIYSLGNFIFSEESNPPDWYKGVLAGFTFHNNSNADLEFYLVSQENQSIKIIDSFTLQQKQNGNANRFINSVDEGTITKEWEKIIKKESLNTIKRLLNLSLLRRVLFKLGFNPVGHKDKRFLLSLGNNHRCSTHRLFTIDSINNFTNSEKIL